MHTEETSPLTMLADFADGPQRLEAVVRALPEGALDLALDENSWTIRQIIHHLADGIDLWKGFIKQAIGAPETRFSLNWYWDIPQAQWPKHWVYSDRPVENSLALFRDCHAQVVELLERIPQAWDLSLTVQFPNREAQTATIGDVIEMQTRHVVGHVSEIHQVLAAHNLKTAGEGPAEDGAALAVSLREVTAETVRAVCRLSDTLTAPQNRMVAPNAVSIAEAHFSKYAWFRAIYAGEKPVGFMMLYIGPEDDEAETGETIYYLWRYMLAAPEQGKGYGRQAMELIFNEVRARGAQELRLSCGEGEGSPEGFYRKMGFERDGRMYDDEVGMVIRFEAGS